MINSRRYRVCTLPFVSWITINIRQGSAIGAEDAASTLSKKKIGKFGWIWAKLRQNLGKSN